MAPDPRWIVKVTRNKIDGQFPGMAIFVSQGIVADSRVPYESRDEIWRVFDKYSTNETASTNGDGFRRPMRRCSVNFLCIPLWEVAHFGPSCFAQLVHASQPNQLRH